MYPTCPSCDLDVPYESAPVGIQEPAMTEKREGPYRCALPATRLRHRNSPPDRRILPKAARSRGVRTSAGQGDGSPIGFYEAYGFRQTGEIVFDDEVLLRLKLR